MNINDLNNKNKIAIVVVGYNRIKSIERLLASLNRANYVENDIPLVISIDRSEDKELYAYVQNFNWPFGDKFVLIQESHLGLKDHIFRCGDLTQFFKAVVVFEDDIFVSTEFYTYVSEAVHKYGEDKRIGGIALYFNDMNGYVGIPFQPLHNGSDSFALQDACTSGQCWTEQMWSAFRVWLDETNINFSEIDMPDQIRHWKKAWSKFYIAYLISTNRFFIFPYISLTTNFGDIGTHGNEVTTIVQVNLLAGKKKYNFLDFEDLEKYDVFQNNIKIAGYLNLNESELCIDLYGANNNQNKKKYWLTILPAPYKIEKCFALQMRPMELNIIYNITGNEIFLYNTSETESKNFRPGISSEYFIYHLKGFRRYFLLKTVIRHYQDALRRKLKMFKKS